MLPIVVSTSPDINEHPGHRLVVFCCVFTEWQAAHNELFHCLGRKKTYDRTTQRYSTDCLVISFFYIRVFLDRSEMEGASSRFIIESSGLMKLFVLACCLCCWMGDTLVSVSLYSHASELTF